jgi:hypothetical protein
MADIQIDAAKAERKIAQIVRDEKGLLPADANALAANICRRLASAMATPTNQHLQGYRTISSFPPHGSGFAAALEKRLRTSTTVLPLSFGNSFTNAGGIFLQQ